MAYQILGTVSVCSVKRAKGRFRGFSPQLGVQHSFLSFSWSACFSATASPNSNKDTDDDRPDGGNEQPARLGYPSRLLARLTAPSAKPSLLSDALPLRVAVRAGVSAFFGIGCLTALHYGPWLSDGWAV